MQNSAPRDKRTRSPSYGKRSAKGENSNQCYEFAKSGKCKYGSKRKYSHDYSARRRSSSRNHRARVVLVLVVALRSGQAAQEVLRDRLPVAALEIHQEAQVGAEILKNRGGSLSRAIAKGVTNDHLRMAKRQRRPHVDAARLPQLESPKTRSQRRTRRTKGAKRKRRKRAQRPVHVFRQVSHCVAQQQDYWELSKDGAGFPRAPPPFRMAYRPSR